jgi:hypothetical protein
VVPPFFVAKFCDLNLDNGSEPSRQANAREMFITFVLMPNSQRTTALCNRGQTLRVSVKAVNGL